MITLAERINGQFLDVKKAIKERDPSVIHELAKKQTEAGATYLDINVGTAAADQEDFVSMGMNTALQNKQILDNAYGILGIEFMAAAQALDFREYQFGKGVETAKKVIRSPRSWARFGGVFSLICRFLAQNCRSGVSFLSRLFFPIF